VRNGTRAVEETTQFVFFKLEMIARYIVRGYHSQAFAQFLHSYNGKTITTDDPGGDYSPYFLKKFLQIESWFAKDAEAHTKLPSQVTFPKLLALGIALLTASYLTKTHGSDSATTLRSLKEASEKHPDITPNMIFALLQGSNTAQDQQSNLKVITAFCNPASKKSEFFPFIMGRTKAVRYWQGSTRKQQRRRGRKRKVDTDVHPTVHTTEGELTEQELEHVPTNHDDTGDDELGRQQWRFQVLVEPHVSSPSRAQSNTVTTECGQCQRPHN
jgi:hypothetical protein